MWLLSRILCASALVGALCAPSSQAAPITSTLSFLFTDFALGPHAISPGDGGPILSVPPVSGSFALSYDPAKDTIGGRLSSIDLNVEGFSYNTSNTRFNYDSSSDTLLIGGAVNGVRSVAGGTDDFVMAFPGFHVIGDSPVFAYTTSTMQSSLPEMIIPSVPVWPNPTSTPLSIAYTRIVFSYESVPSLEADSPAPFSSFEEVISNAVQQPTVVLNSEGHVGIKTNFIPNDGYTLLEAASLGGYDHFNWEQIVVKDDVLSSPFAQLIGNPLRDQYGNLPTVPYIDGPAGGYAYQADACGTPFPVRDDLRWYWDERYSFLNCAEEDPPVIKSEIDGLLSSSPTSLLFEDWPDTPFGYDLSFCTYLAGVRADGTGDVLDNGTGFCWDYIGHEFAAGEILVRENSDSSLGGPGSVIFKGFVDPGSIPEDQLALLASEGVGIRTIMSVPEPSSGSVLLVSLFSLPFLRRRRGSPAIPATELDDRARA